LSFVPSGRPGDGPEALASERKRALEAGRGLPGSRGCRPGRGPASGEGRYVAAVV